MKNEFNASNNEFPADSSHQYILIESLVSRKSTFILKKRISPDINLIMTRGFKPDVSG